MAEGDARVFEHPDMVEFFSSHRAAPGELYPSEARFLAPLAASARSVLDVGCAAGGLASAWRHFASGELTYTGADASSSLIDRARELHPADTFLVGDCAAGLPLPDAAADVVAALGWLHWEPRYPQALRELWRLTGDALFFDVRLHAGDQDRAGRQQVAYLSDWDGHSETPYIVASWPAFARLMLDLEPELLLGHGYLGRPADTARDTGDQVCFATFVLRGHAGGAPTRVALDLPLDLPAGIAPGVTLLDPDSLEDLL